LSDLQISRARDDSDGPAVVQIVYWLKLPAAISTDNATRPRAKSAVFARCAGAWRLRRGGGNFTGVVLPAAQVANPPRLL
jgi:hypothetical protein